MNIWDELTEIGHYIPDNRLGHYIADNRLRAAWERMVLYRTPADCQLVQEIADNTPDAFLYWKLAYRAEELAEMEQSFAREIIKVKK